MKVALVSLITALLAGKDGVVAGVAPSPVAPSPVAPSPVAPSPVAPSPMVRTSPPTTLPTNTGKKGMMAEECSLGLDLGGGKKGTGAGSESKAITVCPSVAAKNHYS
jgi:hypothetical protein